MRLLRRRPGYYPRPLAHPEERRVLLEALLKPQRHTTEAPGEDQYQHERHNAHPDDHRALMGGGYVFCVLGHLGHATRPSRLTGMLRSQDLLSDVSRPRMGSRSGLAEWALTIRYWAARAS